MGYMNETGELFVLGRDGDVITNGVHQVYPQWLENLIKTHSDVEDAVLVPVADRVMVQEICVYAKPAEGAQLTEDILRRIVEELLSTDESTPTPKHFLILDEFPRTITGKLDKKRLRDLAETKLGRMGK